MLNSTKRRILIIDDDRLVRRLVKAALAPDGYDIAEAETGADGLAQAQANPPDLILLDVMLPEMDGFEVCHQLRRNTVTASVPVVMLTSLGEINEKVQGLQIGADDYLTKPFDPRELRMRVEAHLRRRARDLSASPLTGLPGNQLVEQVITGRLASREPLAVLYIDLNNFKSYNDKYGWLKGDEVIKMLARQIMEVVLKIGSKDDFIGHIGGDDFVAISTPACAEPIAREVIARFDAVATQFYSDEDRERGHVDTMDRQGNPVRMPIVSVAVAIITNTQRELYHPLQIATLAAEVKKYVKALPGSQYGFDRRQK
jgi:diguanylate cyclase (GGDEF)-like protein